MWDKTQILALGSDHAGFGLKIFLTEWLTLNGYTFYDFGTFSAESVDYPDFAHQVAASVNNGSYPRGLLICGSGNGVCMTANKYQGIRAGLCWNSEQAELTRRHNNANILCLPGRFISNDEAVKALTLFLDTDFEGGRHQQRVDKIPVK